MGNGLWLLALAIALVATLYASVGHAGASGYIAVMSLLGLAPEEIRPLALTLNVLVASIATWQFHRAGWFRWRLFWPFALLAMPTAFLGGWLALPARVFTLLVGAVLLFSAWQLAARAPGEREPVPPKIPVALATGAGLGLLSGLTGTGGGIFLTPLLILLGWARPAYAAAVSAPFILLNSAAGLAGTVLASGRLPEAALPLLVAAASGGALGSWLGSRRLAPQAIKRVLAAVLVIAGLKLVSGL